MTEPARATTSDRASSKDEAAQDDPSQLAPDSVEEEKSSRFTLPDGVAHEFSTSEGGMLARVGWIRRMGADPQQVRVRSPELMKAVLLGYARQDDSPFGHLDPNQDRELIEDWSQNPRAYFPGPMNQSDNHVVRLQLRRNQYYLLGLPDNVEVLWDFGSKNADILISHDLLKDHGIENLENMTAEDWDDFAQILVKSFQERTGLELSPEMRTKVAQAGPNLTILTEGRAWTLRLKQEDLEKMVGPEKWQAWRKENLAQSGEARPYADGTNDGPLSDLSEEDSQLYQDFLAELGETKDVPGGLVVPPSADFAGLGRIGQLLAMIIVLAFALGVQGCDKSDTSKETSVEGEGTQPEDREDEPETEKTKEAILEIRAQSRKISNSGGSLCLIEEGQLWCSGSGKYLPATKTDEDYALHRLELDRVFMDVDAEWSVCAVDTSHEVICWRAERLYSNLMDPSRGSPPASLGPASLVEVGEFFVCALGTDGVVRCIGKNVSSFFGPEEEFGYFTPEPVEYPAPEGEEWIDLSVGRWHVCALTASGRIFCWGSNTSGEFGVGDTASQSKPMEFPQQSAPFARLATEGGRTCAITTQGELYCAGSATLNSLLQEAPDECGAHGACAKSAVRIDLPKPVVDVGPGQYHTCVLYQDGTVSCFGGARVGQLGHGENPRSGGPTTPDVSGVRELECAANTCCARADDDVFCWGSNANGMIDPALPERVMTPTRVRRTE